jgi:hypothetical protein
MNHKESLKFQSASFYDTKASNNGWGKVDELFKDYLYHMIAISSIIE